MRILLVNKFLYPRGGAETYTMKVGQQLSAMGHDVEYFGMDDERNIIRNQAGLYTTNMDFRAKSLEQLTYPARIIYSREAKEKMGLVLDHFQPEIVHLNNIHFHLTPSVIDACRERNIPVVWTVHDFQLICPNHLLYANGSICEQCAGKHAFPCIAKRCIHGSAVKSVMGVLESELYRHKDLYRYVTLYICPSRFMKGRLAANSQIRHKVFLQNFVDMPKCDPDDGGTGDYVLYFGRLSEEKGITSLVKAFRALPDVKFKVAGSGPCEDMVKGFPNVEFAGFQTGDALHGLIRKARFTLYPSVWYENCPLSILESIQMNVPVITRDLGGMTELIQDSKAGVLVKSDEEFIEQINNLYTNSRVLAGFRNNCRQAKFLSMEEYCGKLESLYRKAIQYHLVYEGEFLR